MTDIIPAPPGLKVAVSLSLDYGIAQAIQIGAARAGQSKSAWVSALIAQHVTASATPPKERKVNHGIRP